MTCVGVAAAKKCKTVAFKIMVARQRSQRDVEVLHAMWKTAPLLSAEQDDIGQRIAYAQNRIEQLDSWLAKARVQLNKYVPGLLVRICIRAFKLVLVLACS